MLRHVVLLKWTESATAEQQAAVIDALHSLPGQIPEIRSYRVGADAGLAAQGNSDLAVVADFDDADGYFVYRDHPVHKDVIARLILPILASRAAAQHELD
jgi:Stress responsive A/B Barrel Domain